MNNQQLYNSILGDIKKISSLNYVTYNGGVNGDKYSAVIYSSEDKLSAIRREMKSETIKGLRHELDLFLYGEY